MTTAVSVCLYPSPIDLVQGDSCMPWRVTQTGSGAGIHINSLLLYQHVFHTVLILCLNYIFKCVFGTIQPVLCWCTIKPSKQILCGKNAQWHLFQMDKWQVTCYTDYDKLGTWIG